MLYGIFNTPSSNPNIKLKFQKGYGMNYVGRSHPGPATPRRSNGATKYPPPSPTLIKTPMPPTLTAAHGYYTFSGPFASVRSTLSRNIAKDGGTMSSKFTAYGFLFHMHKLCICLYAFCNTRVLISP